MIARQLNYWAAGNGFGFMDLFCGLGNLPCHWLACSLVVIGVEGISWVANGQHMPDQWLGQCHNFEMADLTVTNWQIIHGRRAFTKVLLDPPRSGAFWGAWTTADLGAETIVYVSCNRHLGGVDAVWVVINGLRLYRRHMDYVSHYPSCGNLSLYLKKWIQICMSAS